MSDSSNEKHQPNPVPSSNNDHQPANQADSNQEEQHQPIPATSSNTKHQATYQAESNQADKPKKRKRPSKKQRAKNRARRRREEDRKSIEQAKKKRLIITNRSWKVNASGTFDLSLHAQNRMHERGIKREMVIKTLEHGDFKYRRGARIFFVGRKEIKASAGHNIDLRECHGIQVVVPVDGTIRTVYRNDDFSSLR